MDAETVPGIGDCSLRFLHGAGFSGFSGAGECGDERRVRQPNP